MQNIKQKNWLVVAFISLLLFGGFFYLVITNNNKVFLSPPIYFFLIIIIDFAATAFLSGAMRSVARYEVKTQNRSLYIAGPAVIFFIFLYIGYKYRPQVDQSPLTLSILVTDQGSGRLIKEGTVSVRTGLFHDSKNINNEGVALFTGIIGDYKGAKIDVTVDVPGYHLVKMNQYKLGESADFTDLSIPLAKDKDSVFIQGRLIKLPDRKGIDNALINFEGVNGVFKTDSDGNFSAMLPFKSGTEVRVIVLKDKKEIYNSDRTLFDHSFLSISPNNTR